MTNQSRPASTIDSAQALRLLRENFETALDLSGRVAVVTGAARGQGAAEARLLAAFGATVVVTDILPEGEEVAGQIGARFLPLDVASEESWDSVIGSVLAEYGRVDILVNNAAIVHFSPLEDLSLAEFERVTRINLASVFLGMRAVVPSMKAHRSGVIINVSSIAALMGRANLAAYGATKWGVRGLSKSAALELGPHGIRVNTILPGLIETPMTQEAYSAESLLARGLALPVGRVGTAMDVASLALFLASDASGFLTGQEFVCDGGETAGWQAKTNG